MLTYALDRRGELPLYEFLCRRIREDIREGRLRAGEKMPSKRGLAEHLGVSVATVENAYAQLLLEGYLRAEERRGYFVESLPVTEIRKAVPPAALQAEEAEPEWFADIRTNRVPGEQFPFSVWAKLMREVLTERDAALLRPMPGGGTLALRRAIAAYLGRFRGIAAEPEQLVVGAGTEYLYGLLVQLLGRDKVFAVEDPGYRRIAQVYEANGAAVVGAELDGQGLSVRALREKGADAAHLSPAHHFPTGLVMPVSRRRELLQWASEEPERYLIEDDYDSEFRFTGRPVPSLQSIDEGGKVITINTFSKSLTPAIRISYMVLPKRLSEAFSRKLGFYSCTVPSFEQLTLAKFLDGGYFESHLARTRHFYRRRRDALQEAVRKSPLGDRAEMREADAGLHFLLKVQTEASDQELVKRAEQRGVAISCLSEYYMDPRRAEPHCLVMNYTGMERERMEEAVQRLWDCLG